MCNYSWPMFQSSFFAHFMCFEVPSLVDGNKTGHNDQKNDDDLGIMDIDENDSKSGTCITFKKYSFFTFNFIFKLLWFYFSMVRSIVP